MAHTGNQVASFGWTLFKLGICLIFVAVISIPLLIYLFEQVLG